jgi:hypothetical protein
MDHETKECEVAKQNQKSYIYLLNSKFIKYFFNKIYTLLNIYCISDQVSNSGSVKMTMKRRNER